MANSKKLRAENITGVAVYLTPEHVTESENEQLKNCADRPMMGLNHTNFEGKLE